MEHILQMIRKLTRLAKPIPSQFQFPQSEQDLSIWNTPLSAMCQKEQDFNMIC